MQPLSSLQTVLNCEVFNNNICCFINLAPLNFANLHRNWSPPYFCFRSSWPYTDLESTPHVSPLAMKVFIKFKVDTTICWLVISFDDDTLRVTWPCDLDLRPFVLGQWLYMAGDAVNPSKFEDPVAIRSWVMSSDISHRIPLTMRLQPSLRMRRITWPMRRVQLSLPHIWNPWPRFAYSLYYFFGATIKINGVIWQNGVWPLSLIHNLTLPTIYSV